MSEILGDNAGKWMKLILSFLDDPSKYDLPRKVFILPEGVSENVNAHLAYAKKMWQKVNPRSVKPFDNLEETIPYWMVFTLPRRPAILFLAVWDEYLETKDREKYQDIQYNFQELIQNFIREELLLYKLVKPFRKRTGHSLLQKSHNNDKFPDNVYNQLVQFTSPQKVLYNVAHFVRNRTIQSGIAYILLIERLASLVAKTRTIKHLVQVTEKFIADLEKLRKVDFTQKIPNYTHTKSVQKERPEIEEEMTIIEFDEIELQEYDGYVEIRCHCEEESRNFRIYNCLEEDELREEMWKFDHGSSIYPLRRLVSSVLEEKYSRPTREYRLKYGVDLRTLPPNWVS